MFNLFKLSIINTSAHDPLETHSIRGVQDLSFLREIGEGLQLENLNFHPVQRSKTDNLALKLEVQR